MYDNFSRDVSPEGYSSGSMTSWRPVPPLLLFVFLSTIHQSEAGCDLFVPEKWNDKLNQRLGIVDTEHPKDMMNCSAERLCNIGNTFGCNLLMDCGNKDDGNGTSPECNGTITHYVSYYDFICLYAIQQNLIEGLHTDTRNYSVCKYATVFMLYQRIVADSTPTTTTSQAKVLTHPTLKTTSSSSSSSSPSSTTTTRTRTTTTATTLAPNSRTSPIKGTNDQHSDNIVGDENFTLKNILIVSVVLNLLLLVYLFVQQRWNRERRQSNLFHGNSEGSPVGATIDNTGSELESSFTLLQIMNRDNVAGEEEPRLGV
ncbi:uncharacterized protein LOC134878069 isoform X2 [Eleginops maclovinus]|uniref:uncharacterized protein LOC134878069 isoform X2 n=1 Tax=Eleginops maclovinus TaxID=56733 RepID=UPI00307FD0E0